ncbi:MAG: 3-deoxy-7-phosphoheptulonate synthase [Gammaproteobacteria bacterium]|nr:3-deoxy-7-phosphoheptulonate synthase [Gammaproteobacteria bacterium]
MILILKAEAKLHEIEKLIRKLQFMGFQSSFNQEEKHKVIVITQGMNSQVNLALFKALPLVEEVKELNDKLKLVGKSFKKQQSQINLKRLKMGDGGFVVMAGPCSIESKTQIFEIAKEVSEAGATVLRGGAFKPRTSPYDFQGLGEIGLQYLREAADAFGMLCVSEVMCTDDLSLVEQYVDILQLGARNMQNYSLLKAVGKSQKPVLLKRGLSATYQEFLSAAEYIISSGNPNVILCERGIRTFETYSRNTLDLAAVPILRELTHLPIIIDPSHGVGLRKAVPPMANAAIAVQADGLIVEVHTHPDASVSDAAQTISTNVFSNMMQTLQKLGDVLGMHVKGALA